jgi:hypothetical protein
MPVMYQCPTCGAALKFGADEGCLVCEYCDNKLDAAAVEKLKEDIKKTEKIIEEEAAIEGKWERGETIDFGHYNCTTCAAEMITDEHTIADMCNFCGNPTLIKSRVAGEYKPSKVIPFKVNKETVVARFKKWTSSSILVPAEFKNSAPIEEIKGVYVPYWLYDFGVDVDMNAQAKKVRTTRSANTEYVNTDHYAIKRKISVDYERLPVDGSKQLDNTFMSYVEPFEYKELKNFEMPYLSGFLAEKYSVTDKEHEKDVRRRAENYAISACRDTIVGYNSVNVTNKSTISRQKKVEYVLMPVWFLTYKYKNKPYTFAINGQTGKQVGDLPISIKKTFVLFLATALGSFLIMNIISVVGGLLR